MACGISRGALRRRKVKIDRRLIQNPAYGPVVFAKSCAAAAAGVFAPGPRQPRLFCCGAALPRLAAGLHRGRCCTKPLKEKAAAIPAAVPLLLHPNQIPQIRFHGGAPRRRTDGAPCFKSGGLPPPPGCAFLSGPPGGLSGGGTFPGRRGGRPRCSGRNSSAGRRGGTA